MNTHQKKLESLADRCRVCRQKLPAESVTTEYLGQVYTFCSDKCLKDYLAEPEKYTGSFPAEEEME
jgi:YHS domain-containing protein